jgi:hypothetical protein
MTAFAEVRTPARLIAVLFVAGLLIEIGFRPIGQLLMHWGVVPTGSARHLVLTVHDLALGVVAVAVFASGRLPLILTPSPLREFARGVVASVPFLAPVALCAWIWGTPHVVEKSMLAVALAFVASALYVALAEELLLRGLLQQRLEMRLSPRRPFGSKRRSSLYFISRGGVPAPSNCFSTSSPALSSPCSYFVGARFGLWSAYIGRGTLSHSHWMASKYAEQAFRESSVMAAQQPLLH